MEPLKVLNPLSNLWECVHQNENSYKLAGIHLSGACLLTISFYTTSSYHSQPHQKICQHSIHIPLVTVVDSLGPNHWILWAQPNRFIFILKRSDYYKAHFCTILRCWNYIQLMVEGCIAIPSLYTQSYYILCTVHQLLCQLPHSSRPSSLYTTYEY